MSVADVGVINHPYVGDRLFFHATFNKISMICWFVRLHTTTGSANQMFVKVMCPELVHIDDLICWQAATSKMNPRNAMSFFDIVFESDLKFRILFNWLRIQDIGKLDIAISCKNKRVCFLNLIKSYSSTFAQNETFWKPFICDSS